MERKSCKERKNTRNFGWFSVRYLFSPHLIVLRATSCSY